MPNKSQPASTPEERGMVLSTLPLAMRQTFFSEKMKEGAFEWLDAARENGVFDVSAHGTPAEAKNDALSMLDAAIGFIKTFKYGDTKLDPVMGLLPDWYVVPLFYAKPGMADAFTRLADHFIELEARFDVMRRHEVDAAPLTDHFARLMAGAAVLSLPDCMRRLAMASPDAVSAPLPFSLLGPNAKGADGLNSNVWPTPYGIALMFSAADCLDQMAKHASNKGLPIGIEIHGHMGTVQESTLDRYFQLNDQYCLPGAFAQALKHVLAGPITERQRKAYVDLAMSAMNDSLTSRDILRPAFRAAGLYDVDPAKSVAHALMTGREEIIRDLKVQIPWDDVGFTRSEKESPMVICLMEAQLNAREKEYENAMLAVIELAGVDGKLDLVLHQFVQPLGPVDKGDEPWWGPVNVEPLVRTIGMGFDRVVLKYLERGMDPNAPAAPGAWTPQQMADAMPTSASAVMRSYVARERSRALIDEIEGLDAGVTPSSALQP